jgi:hypothetical protein
MLEEHVVVFEKWGDEPSRATAQRKHARRAASRLNCEQPERDMSDELEDERRKQQLPENLAD